MVWAADLDDLDPFDLLDAEAARLERLFASLDADGWTRPSRCAGWRVRDVLAHLAGEELYNHACLDDDLEGLGARLASAGIEGLRGFNEWCVRTRAELPVEQVVEEWRTKNGETRRRMRALGRAATLPTMTGPYPVGLQTFHYASEYATHADDVAAPVDPGEAEARTAWRARFGRFALAEIDAPVTVLPDDGGYRVTLDGETAELTPEEFVEATVGRLPDSHPLPRSVRDALRCLA